MPHARRTVAHLSDLHLRRPGTFAPQPDAAAHLSRALAILTSWNVACDAWVFSGDLSDDGSPESYARVRSLVGAAARAEGVQVIWGNGNHDSLAAFRAGLLGGGTGPVNTEHWIGGLRILTVDSTVAGVAWGEYSAATLAWLAERLATSAPEGTLLVTHHAPLPQPQAAPNTLWPLVNPEALADLMRGSDVRGILAGHVHQASFGMLAGVPVMVAPALAYGQDLTAGRDLRSQDAGQGFSLVEVYDHTIVSTPVLLDTGPAVAPVIAADGLDRLGEPWRR